MDPVVEIDPGVVVRNTKNVSDVKERNAEHQGFIIEVIGIQRDDFPRLRDGARWKRGAAGIFRAAAGRRPGGGRKAAGRRPEISGRLPEKSGQIQLNPEKSGKI